MFQYFICVSGLLKWILLYIFIPLFSSLIPGSDPSRINENKRQTDKNPWRQVAYCGESPPGESRSEFKRCDEGDWDSLSTLATAG